MQRRVFKRKCVFFGFHFIKLRRGPTQQSFKKNLKNHFLMIFAATKQPRSWFRPGQFKAYLFINFCIFFRGVFYDLKRFKFSIR